MLLRILEPELMDTPEEALAYDAMDHREVNRRFVDDFLAAWGVDARPPDDAPEAPWIDLLDLGTGTGRIPIELCRRPDTDRIRVMAVDAAGSMLDQARLNIEIAGLMDRIVLDRVDAKQVRYEAERFDAVISNSLLHHLPEPGAALAEAVRLVKPGGALFFRDLLRPPDDAAVQRLVHQYAGDETAEQQKMFDDSLRAALSLSEVRDLVSALRFDPRQVRTTSDRHWTWFARRPAESSTDREREPHV